MKLLKLIFLLFLFILFLFGFFIWRNQYSKEVLKIEIFGPKEVDFGQEGEYTVQVKNNGNFRLEEGELVFVVPQDCLLSESSSERKLIKLSEPLYPGESKSFSFKVKLFGKEGERKTLQASFSFRPKNLKARYVNSTSFDTFIKSIPLTFELNLPTRFPPQREVTLKIHYFSSLNTVLTNLRVKLEFPPGNFEFISSNLPAIDGKEWNVFALNQYEGGTIEIKGKLYGEVDQIILFKAKLGIIKDGQFIVMKETEKAVKLIKPSIYVRQEINGNPEYIASPGDWLHYEIFFKNIGDEDLSNLFLIIKLEGDYFDFKTVKAETGSYQSGDNSLIFDWRENKDLEFLPQMKEGKVDFWVRLKEEILKGKNPTIKTKIILGETREEFVTKIASKLQFSQKGFFDDEIFGNSGALPPRVNEETTYTIVWELDSKGFSFSNVKVVSKLPLNVSLTGKIFPEEEISKFSLDTNTREIIWLIDQIEGKKSIAFQVKLIPTNEDRGKIPTLVGNTKVSAMDLWTEKEISFEVEKIDTFLKDDPSITKEKAIVQ